MDAVEYYAGESFSQQRVFNILKTHNISRTEFLDDFKLQDSYDAVKILGWLGY